ncbi:MAG: hypothetical protein FWC50_07720 [Planctomycetaceae bacterium]|nr:hypothetical protein [Planctomycetaceae bacterium]
MERLPWFDRLVTRAALMDRPVFGVLFFSGRKIFQNFPVSMLTQCSNVAMLLAFAMLIA